MPVYVCLDDLNEEAFVKILTEPKNALVKQYAKLFKMDNIKLEITADAVKAVAQKAKKLKTGARGLRAIIEEAIKDIMFIAPSKQNVEKIIVTKNVIEGKEDPKIVYKENKEEAV